MAALQLTKAHLRNSFAMPRLFRRRAVWVPTAWGWLVIATALAATTGLAARHLGSWLAVTAPLSAAEGGPARVLVVEGWLGARELADAAAFARARGYARVLTSGGPIDEPLSPFANFADRAALSLRPQLPGIPVDAVSSPHTKQNRTYASAVWLRDWAQRQPLALEAVDVYSQGPHARRTRMLYAMALGDGTRVGVIAGAPHDVDLQQWWTSSEAAKSVMSESISLAWTVCCFWPPPRSSHEERWAVPSH